MPISDSIPDLGINVGGVLTSVTWLILIGIIAIVTATLTFIVVWNLKFNRKIVIFENLAGQGYVPVGKDRAMRVKIGEDGLEVLYLRKRKVYKSSQGKKIGKNTYWFAIGSDGYWRNFTLADMDKTLEAMDVQFTDKDMRAFHTGIRRGLKERYDKAGFWEKYGGLIAYVSLIAITGIMMWLLFDKYIDVSNAVSGAVASAGEVLEATKQILGAIDSVGSTGSLVQ